MSLFGLADTVLQLVDKYVNGTENEHEQEKLKLDIKAAFQDKEHELKLKQIETTQIEIKNPNSFRGGYRAFAGWVCALGLAYATIVQPFLSWIAIVCFGFTGSIPEIDAVILIELLVAILGLGGFKMAETIKIGKKLN